MPSQSSSFSSVGKRKASRSDTDDDGSPAKRTRGSGSAPRHFVPLVGAPAEESSPGYQRADGLSSNHHVSASSSKRPLTYQTKGPRADRTPKRPSYKDDHSEDDYEKGLDRDQLETSSKGKGGVMLASFAGTKQPAGRRIQRPIVEIVSPKPTLSRSTLAVASATSRKYSSKPSSFPSLAILPQPKPSASRKAPIYEDSDDDDELLLTSKKNSKAKEITGTKSRGKGLARSGTSGFDDPNRRSTSDNLKPTPASNGAGPQSRRSAADGRERVQDSTKVYMPLPKLQGVIKRLPVLAPPPLISKTAEEIDIAKRGHPVSSVGRKGKLRASKSGRPSSNPRDEVTFSRNGASNVKGEKTTTSSRRTTRHTRLNHSSDTGSPARKRLRRNITVTGDDEEENSQSSGSSSETSRFRAPRGVPVTVDDISDDSDQDSEIVVRPVRSAAKKSSGVVDPSSPVERAVSPNLLYETVSKPRQPERASTRPSPEKGSTRSSGADDEVEVQNLFGSPSKSASRTRTPKDSNSHGTPRTKVPKPIFDAQTTSDDDIAERTHSPPPSSSGGEFSNENTRSLSLDLTRASSTYDEDTIMNSVLSESPSKKTLVALPSSLLPTPELVPLLNAQKSVVLRSLNSPKAHHEQGEKSKRLVYAHQAVDSLYTLLRGTTERGEGNSCLLLGPRGSGKTRVSFSFVHL